MQIHISNMFLGDGDAADPGTSPGEPLINVKFPSVAKYSLCVWRNVSFIVSAHWGSGA